MISNKPSLLLILCLSTLIHQHFKKKIRGLIKQLKMMIFVIYLYSVALTMSWYIENKTVY